MSTYCISIELVSLCCRFFALPRIHVAQFYGTCGNIDELYCYCYIFNYYRNFIILNPHMPSITIVLLASIDIWRSLHMPGDITWINDTSERVKMSFFPIPSTHRKTKQSENKSNHSINNSKKRPVNRQFNEAADRHRG